MKFIKMAKKALICPILGVFLAVFALPVSGMAPQIPDSWIFVDMNDAKAGHIPAQSRDNYTFFTKDLCGCVVTIINLEHAQGDHTIAMSHFAPNEKNVNYLYLHALLDSLEKSKKLNGIRKATCTFCPPGIYKSWLGIPGTSKITPIFNIKWENEMRKIVQGKIARITFEIKPYLFNTLKSSIQYSFNPANGLASCEITNNESIVNEDCKDLLFTCHKYKSTCEKVEFLVVPTIALALAGCTYYYSK